MNLRELKSSGSLAHDIDAVDVLELLHPERDQHSSMPWIGRLALGMGAWLSGIFLLVFLLMLLDQANDAASAAIGLVLVIGSILLLRLTAGIFKEQLALALGFAGHLLFFVGLFELTSDNVAAPVVGAAVLCFPVYWLSKHSVQRFLSVGFVWSNWLLMSVDYPNEHAGMTALMVYFALAAVCLLLSGKVPGPVWRPAMWASVFGLIGGIIWMNSFYSENSDTVHLSMTPMPLGLVAAIAMSGLLIYLTRPRELKIMVPLAVFGLLLVGLGLAGAPGIVVGLGLMAIAHARSYRRLEMVAIGALGLFLIEFYYHLGIPLVEKAVILMASGAILLSLHPLLFRNSHLLKADTSGESTA